MHWAGYLAASLIGISLGLVGGGGSILTIPVLVYLFGVQPLAATGYSLFIVGSTSLVGAVRNFRKGQVNMPTAVYFSLISTITVLLTRKFLIGIIPDKLLSIGSITVTKSMLTMLLFASVMLFASIKMIKAQPIIADPCRECRPPISKIFINAIGIGLMTGLLGAGGGFMIIPALIFSFRLNVRDAIGTSLMIIAINNLIGFSGDVFHSNIDWMLLLSVTSVAVVGIFIGTTLGQKIHGDKLKKVFGWFVLIMGIYVIIRELMR